MPAERRQTRHKRQPVTLSSKRKTRRLSYKQSCKLLTQAPALNYLSPLRGNDFYTWVNEAWLKKNHIPPHEVVYDTGSETAECIYKKSIEILGNIRSSKSKSDVDNLLRDFSASCLHSRSQQNSVAYLQQILHTLHCLSTPEDVFQKSAELNYQGFRSFFSLQLTIDNNQKCQIFLDNNPAGLFYRHYHDREIMGNYKKLLEKVGKLFGIDNLEKVALIEKYIADKSEEYYSDTRYEAKGNELLRKFPGLPWKIFFEAFEIYDWKQKTIYYSSPRYIRFVGKLLKQISIENWKLFLANCYILPSLQLLPPPFDEIDYDFFDKTLTGMKVKTPQMDLLFQLINTYLPNEFSELYWKEEGNKKLLENIKEFSESIVHAAKQRVKEAEWLESKTRIKAIEKLDKMKQSLAKPTYWMPFEPIELDPKNLVKNVYLLGKRKTRNLLRQVGKEFTFWDESILRVNAFYYTENNQIVIPYGQILPPFYSKEASVGWNYGALGTIIGHEICHGFDADGKDYDAKGRKNPWWTAKNNRHYAKKTKKLIELYNSEKILGIRIQGQRMLSENLADLAGVAIALEALKNHYKHEKKEVLQEAYREFFIAYAISWRTQYREERLKRLLERDKHAPANLRVNLVVSQFQEWIDAFGIDEEAKYYKDMDERIQIF